VIRRAAVVGLLALPVSLFGVAAGVVRPAAVAYAQVVDPACAWEQGGEPEPTPAPCLTPAPVDQVTGDGTFGTSITVGVAILVFLTAVATVFAWSRRS
jgi:hypothetical protein